MQILIEDDICWMCGKPFDTAKSLHHGIPQHLNPKKNIRIPVHQSCHDKINEIDVAGIKTFVIMLLKSSEKNNQQVDRLLKLIESLDTVTLADLMKKRKEGQ